MHDGGAISIRVVRDLEGMKALSGKWEELLSVHPAPSICLTFEWLYTWLEVYQSPALEPRILVVQLGAEVIGIAPLMVQQGRRFGFLPVRTLRFLGTGEMDHEAVVSEYLDVLAMPASAAAVAEAVVEFLMNGPNWDCVDFCDVLDKSLTKTRLLGAMQGRGVQFGVREVGLRYCVELGSDWKGYLESLPGGSAQRIEYKRRKLSRAGSLRMDTVTRPEELEPAFDILVRLHTRRWKAAGHRGAFSSLIFRRFHRAVAERLLASGRLKLRTLWLDDRPVASIYNFRLAAIEFNYQGGVDISLGSRYSPGSVGHAMAIEEAIRDKLRHYDLMRGAADSHKSEYGCSTEPMFDLQGFARTPVGLLLRLIGALRSVLRRANAPGTTNG